jgi:hypothetical protein
MACKIADFIDIVCVRTFQKLCFEPVHC